MTDPWYRLDEKRPPTGELVRVRERGEAEPVLDSLRDNGHWLIGGAVLPSDEWQPVRVATGAELRAVVPELLDAPPSYAPHDPHYVHDLEGERDRLEEAMRAIVARIEGEYDNPALLRAGPLGDQDSDVLRLAREALGEE